MMTGQILIALVAGSIVFGNLAYGQGHHGKAKAAAVELPPIGKRIYVRNEGDTVQPVAIERSEPAAKSVEFIRDPQHPDAKVSAPPPPPRRVVQSKKPKELDRSKLRFSAMPVPGRLTQPRVQFKEPRVPVNRVDRKPRVDFFDEIFAPTRQRDF